jgi:hypothetical protein
MSSEYLCVPPSLSHSTCTVLIVVVIHNHHHHHHRRHLWWWRFQQSICWRLLALRYLGLTEHSIFKYLLSLLCSLCNCVSVTGVNYVYNLMCALRLCAHPEKLDCTCLNKEWASYHEFHICGTKVMVVLDSWRSLIPSSMQKQVLSFPIVGSCSETQRTSKMSGFSHAKLVYMYKGDCPQVLKLD